ncbi:hypothetical protein P9160_09165 [Bacillus halotolerans]|uniref:Uncharacterized protein n=1 Tax=Bacillus halotolerans TaxID=260554 RepID=A0A9Q4EIT5_9BACI|nr:MULTISPECIES: hypothetical protein [Bacillus]MCY9185072.1 hypothetical protein [Bacillus halotolerans]MCY9202475.1 hypothetical protein [Bacillus halotolerans]MEC3757533.1 hypothetical protein [Bacillus halotolerans]PAY11955.1 hypothetical protein CJU60_17030 [Bacillus sp. 7705b]QPZ41067.1 hypothetical protein I7X10_14180 [Bacillus halotolerans]
METNPKTVQQDDDKFFGFVLAAVSILIGCVLYFSWDTFGNETAMKLLSMIFLVFGICGLGVELSKVTLNDGALEMCIGLGVTIIPIILKDIFNGFPNLIALFIIAFGFLFIGKSALRLYKPKPDKPKPKLIFRIMIATGQLLGFIVNVNNFVKMFF